MESRGYAVLNSPIITLYDIWLSSYNASRSGKCSENARAVGVVVRQGIDIYNTQSHGRLVA